MKKTLVFLFFIFVQNIIFAQKCQTFIVQDAKTKELLIGATLLVIGKTNGAASDENGQAKICNLSRGQKIAISYIGYKNDTLQIADNQQDVISVLLNENEATVEEVIVTSTRTNNRIEDAATKIEVLGLEELKEESSIKPSNIASILGDISSIQIQQSSAVTGNAAVRMFGLGSKYTQLLRDGMPAFDGFSGGFGILQVAPLDLKQVEIIKGASSTLYGGGAIGGIINFVSKKPSDEPEASLTLNQSSLGESTINLYGAKKFGKFGVSLFAGANNQEAKDVNKDGFTDLAKSVNINVHPRFFYNPDKNTELIFGVNGTHNTINGGDIIALKTPDATHTFFEKNTINRASIELQYSRHFENKNLFLFKNMLSVFERTLHTNTYDFQGEQKNYFAEASYLIPREKYQLVFGAALNQKDFNNLIDNSLYPPKYAYKTIGAFAQYNRKLSEKANIETGLRVDKHSKYGVFALPSLAFLYKINKDFSLRFNGGLGYQTPDALTSSNKDFDLNKILPVADSMRSETAYSGSAEWNYKHLFSNNLSLFFDQTFFITDIKNPILANVRNDGFVTLKNENAPIRTLGVDNYFRLGIPKWELYVGYTLTVPKQLYNTAQPYVPYTPINRAAMTLVYEPSEKWRFGLESSYTGAQRRENGSLTKNFIFMAAMIRYNFKTISLVANVENILDVRQTRFESIVIPPLSNPSFKTLWAPIDGRVGNISLVWKPKFNPSRKGGL